MAIEERQVNSKQWEIKATGEDIGKLRGMLTETGNEAYKKAFHSNEGQYVKVSDPNGNPTEVHAKDLDTALAQGYGRVTLTPSMIMPEVPWKKKPQTPGKHKYRYDKATGQMVEVT